MLFLFNFILNFNFIKFLLNVIKFYFNFILISFNLF